jgi:hypothetical protein
VGAVVGQELGQMSNDLTRREVTLSPTIEIRAGYAST